MNKPWRTINESLNRNLKNETCLQIYFNGGVELSDAKEIATAFNTYLATISDKN